LWLLLTRLVAEGIAAGVVEAARLADFGCCAVMLGLASHLDEVGRIVWHLLVSMRPVWVSPLTPKHRAVALSPLVLACSLSLLFLLGRFVAHLRGSKLRDHLDSKQVRLV
jgi:hypothetical protein